MVHLVSADGNLQERRTNCQVVPPLKYHAVHNNVAAGKRTGEFSNVWENETIGEGSQAILS